MRIAFTVLLVAFLLVSCTKRRNDGMGSLWKGVGCIESPDQFTNCK